MAHDPTIERHRRAARVAFARRMLAVDDAELQRIVFSDEARFTTNDGHRWPIAPAGAAQSITERRPAAVTVHVSLATDFAELTFLPDRHTARSYQLNALSKIVNRLQPPPAARGRPSKRQLARRETPRGRLFAHDGAVQHVAASTVAFLAANDVNVVTQWPKDAGSINPMAPLWRLLAARVRDRGPWSRHDLEAAVTAEWAKVTPAVRRSLVVNFRVLLRKCIVNGGHVVVGPHGASTAEERERRRRRLRRRPPASA